MQRSQRERQTTRRKKRRGDPLAPIMRRVNRLLSRLPPLPAPLRKLRIPRLGPVATMVGLAGLVFGTVALSLVVAIVLRAFVRADAFNPFRDTDEIVSGPLEATPNPDLLAPAIDLGNAPVWQGVDRVTVLLLGTDTRPSEQGYRTRSDTIMLLMLDPVTKQASMLSVPRDLYVDLPGRGLNRVNTAYVYGGGQLAVDTIEYNLGVHVNYYVVVNFNVFVTLVDEIGGIDIYVPKEIRDPTYPDENFGYDPFYISAGQHHLDGATALKYARTRHADNDYERARRQQAVVLAIRERILSLDMLPTLVQRAPALYATLSDSIKTDMTLEEMISLALLAEDIPEENIRTGVIDSQYVVGYYTPEGASVLIPNRESIGALLSYVFWLE
jgi:LCP family protein required for cell wall assembly